jgi:hypothetical protein
MAAGERVLSDGWHFRSLATRAAVNFWSVQQTEPPGDAQCLKNGLRDDRFENQTCRPHFGGLFTVNSCIIKELAWCRARASSPVDTVDRLYDGTVTVIMLFKLRFQLD